MSYGQRRIRHDGTSAVRQTPAPDVDQDACRPDAITAGRCCGTVPAQVAGTVPQPGSAHVYSTAGRAHASTADNV
ncbi:hypothetical protein ACWGJ6_45215, partial [Streptomyces canus]